MRLTKFAPVYSEKRKTNFAKLESKLRKLLIRVRFLFKNIQYKRMTEKKIRQGAKLLDEKNQLKDFVRLIYDDNYKIGVKSISGEFIEMKLTDETKHTISQILTIRISDIEKQIKEI